MVKYHVIELPLDVDWKINERKETGSGKWGRLAWKKTTSASISRKSEM
jgi:hypothetical protein